MNASFHSFRDILVAHPQDSSSPENFAPVVIGYRNIANNKDIVETSSNISSSHLSFMDESSNDFNNHQLIHPNSLIKVCGGCGVCSDALEYVPDVAKLFPQVNW
ncbi:uncharacterized protein LOC111081322 isoform X3 [Drosophila obscura]|uniref:uncharacterized protein LOC111081322 isoform X3 n=1 Tax=Drosophila obscura TaxID=7282 RepID=UPI001BB19F0D|nr:uncharacterized protein LOC111081322 isoform X3 [Drosophila obscura]